MQVAFWPSVSASPLLWLERTSTVQMTPAVLYCPFPWASGYQADADTQGSLTAKLHKSGMQLRDAVRLSSIFCWYSADHKFIFCLDDLVLLMQLLGIWKSDYSPQRG